ncbi:hypothetical protein RI129_012169 [Pyrocoelia pectoralis]|uniref:Uncharacterized protein n=1 Tax=Pyrocoelia pectoralis TaxID=417401 RepID=A0AAN7ZDP5_9COLE
MSIPRSSINDYPEHLNPFYEGDPKFKFWKFGKVKRSSSFGESLRNTLLFKSIRGKKSKEKGVPVSPSPLRNTTPNVAPSHRQTLPTIYSTNQCSIRNSTPVPLPRSRFSERVAKSNVQTQSTEATQTAPNPFLQDQVPTPPTRQYIKRKKRRAPLPPNDGSSVSSTHNLSKWSLTSDCTDMSTYSDSEITIDPEVSIRIAHITKEIQKMTEDENDSKEEINEDQAYSTDIPDVVIGIQVDKSQSKNLDGPTDENYNVVNGTSFDDDVEDKGPDVVHHTTCNESDVAVSKDEERSSFSSTAGSIEDMDKIDSLTNLINSINVEDANTDENDFELKEVDSLTNIINSISFTENEAFERKIIGYNCDVEVNGISNCDNETIEANRSDEEIIEDETFQLKKKLKEKVEDDHLHA